MQTPTTGSKPHYPILDGLRGVAAVLVVIFHLVEAHFHNMAEHPMHHGYLAVDFFFLLSGFVVGYAYDDRWNRMGIWDFVKIRLLRLHPLVILGTLIGAICFWFDPYTDGQSHTSLLKLLGVTLMAFTLLPSPDVRGWNETHSLDGPCWSLLQEYMANVIYALIGKRVSKAVLWIIVAVSALALIAVAVNRGDIGTGWGYDTFWIAVVRMMFPFFAGLLLHRTGKRIRLPIAFTVCSVLLALLFCIPYSKYNGLSEAATIIIAFPFIVAAGAGGEIKGKLTARVCQFFGDISYPIYITHYPLIYIYTAWIGTKHPSSQQYLPVTIGLFGAMILVAYLSLKVYDEPVRAWLKKKLL